MKHLTKRCSKLLILVVIIAILLIFGCCAWAWIISNSELDSTSFFYISLEETICIIIDILIGGVIAVLILYLGELNNNNRRIQDAIRDILNEISSLFTDKLSKLDSEKLGEFWTNSLFVKKLSSQLINNIESLNYSSIFSNSIDKLKKLNNQYFEFVENNCYPTATISNETYKKETSYRCEIIVMIRICICDIFKYE